MDLKDNLRDQTIAGITNQINQVRIESLNRELEQLSTEKILNLDLQDQAFIKAQAYVNEVRDFLGSPQNILGSESTKHGEIAEQIEVQIRNARSVLEHNDPIATFDGVGRTAPEDYLLNGIDVQSKFINGLNNNLDHVLSHMGKYDYFGRDGSYYIVPNDHFQKISEVLKGHNPDNLSQRTIDKILEKVQSIELKTGKSFDEVVKPSISDYKEVQQGVVFKTLNGHEESLVSRNNELKETINKKFENDKANVIDTHAPSLNEAMKVGLIGGVVGGGLSASVCMYKKIKAGKKIFDFDLEDWKDIGLDFGKGGLKGSISGLTIYGLTNFANMAAPLAGAFVTTTMGIGSLVISYKKGEISREQLMEQGQILCVEGAIVSIGATIGQTLIPIPVIGALIGTLASKTLISLLKEYLGKEAVIFIKKLEEEYEKALKNIEIAYREVVRQIIYEYERLGTITKMAFDFERNSSFRLQKSIELAVEYGVENKKILRTISEADDYFLS